MAPRQPRAKLFDLVEAEAIPISVPQKAAFDAEEELDPYDVFPDATVEDKPVDDPHSYMYAYRTSSHMFLEKPVHEPILSLSNASLVFNGTAYPSIMDNYLKQKEAMWAISEANLTNDLYDWEHYLTAGERIFVMLTLAFFAFADGLVNINVAGMINLVTIKEAQFAYAAQADQENLHARAYSKMIETYIPEAQLRSRVFNAVKRIPVLKEKQAWGERWINDDTPFAIRLIAFAVMEGVYFSGSFAAIFFFKTRIPAGKKRAAMSGLRKMNRWIARDEGLHVELAVLLFRLLLNRPKQEIVHQIVREAVLIEDRFINESLKCRLLGINAALMSQYIRYCADELLVSLGYEKLYNCTIGLEYMAKKGVSTKINFFEEHVDEYVSIGNSTTRTWKRREEY